MLGAIQVISCYSLLQSPLRLEELVTAAKERGYQALALTDRNVMYGTAAFYQLCRQQQLKPLIGMTLELAVGNEIILIAENQIGYQNLLQLSTQKNQLLAENKTEFPLEKVQAFLQGLLVITPLTNSLVINCLQNGKQATAAEFVAALRQQVGQSRLFLGTSPQLSAPLRQAIKTLADQNQVALTALEPVNYLDPADEAYLKVLRAIRQGSRLETFELQEKSPVKAWLQPVAKITAAYQAAGMTTALQQTAEICRTATFNLQFRQPKLPHYPVPKQQTAAKYLQQLCLQGLSQRGIDLKAAVNEKYRQRLSHELAVIQRMGFADYFLIVWDVTNYAHRAKIVIGPGRGSAAGSLVAYALAITDVDPLYYDLLFERFLNEERIQMPDIDLDIPDNRRQEVIEYVQQRYGKEHVAQIITFGTLGARQALRDVGRALGFSQFELNSFSHLIPHQLKITLASAFEQSPRLRDKVAANEKNQWLFKTARYLEGLPRHFSVHAAGVILSDQDLKQLVPLQVGSDGMPLTQYSKDYVEQLGLLKIDFLGLRNLSVLDRALRLVKRNYQTDFDIHQIPLDDPLTLKLFQRAQTAGVFQFESAGIRNVLRRLQPQSFEDLTAVNALFRPGPMENIDHFIARKHGQEPVTYPAQALKPILSKTYGILVYQEQVMQVASVMAGFSLGQADILRRAMSKKKLTLIDQLRTKFLAGAQERGYSAATAGKVYDYIERFANYGFNRSHAVAYTKMAFELAYLKCHFPAAFMAALLNSVIGDNEKTKEYLLEARQLKTTVHSPDLNLSQFGFSLYKRQIVFGLNSIRSLRRDFVWTILKERQQNGRFKSFQDFLQRMPEKYLKTDSLQALIYSGAGDTFGQTRATLLHNLPKILDNRLLSGNNVELLAVLAPKLEEFPEITLNERLSQEEKYLGTFISAHPVTRYARLAQLEKTTPIVQLQAEKTGRILLYLKESKIIRTKKGEQMAFLTGEDETGQIEVIVFPNIYRQAAAILENDQVYLIAGKVQLRNQRRQLVAVQVKAAANMKIPMKKTFFIRLTKSFTSLQKQQLWQLMRRYPGSNPVIIYEAATAKKLALTKDYWLADRPELIKALVEMVGKENLVLKNENE